MAISETDASLTYDELEALAGERETTLHTLRQQIRALEMERDQALAGLEALTSALRRRGCCEDDVNGASL